MAAIGRVDRQDPGESGNLPRPTAGHNRTPAVLFIDDDVATRDVVRSALTLFGMDVETAKSAAEGLAVVRQRRFDLLIVDQRLPDVPGTELIRLMRQEGLTGPPFVLVSAFLTTAITVEAMKLGAVNVIEKPLDVGDLVALVSNALADVGAIDRTARVEPAQQPETRDMENARPGSAAERWALHVLKGCEATRDLKTIEDWATYIGVSYSSLRESCHVLGISAHDARDLMRMLRVLLRSRRERCSPEVLLDVSDGRTLGKLLQRATLTGDVATVTPQRFLREQHFIPRENAGLRVLRLLLAQRHRD